jgi:hypothetical protein
VGRAVMWKTKNPVRRTERGLCKSGKCAELLRSPSSGRPRNERAHRRGFSSRAIEIMDDEPTHWLTVYPTRGITVNELAALLTRSRPSAPVLRLHLTQPRDRSVRCNAIQPQRLRGLLLRLRGHLAPPAQSLKPAARRLDLPPRSNAPAAHPTARGTRTSRAACAGSSADCAAN